MGLGGDSACPFAIVVGTNAARGPGALLGRGADMRIQYFQTAWRDIKNSPGWFGKLCLLALINFIPIFGQIVTYGYLYGWAREIAWGTHEPMPRSIFENEDGKFWRRGWFALVTIFVFSLIPAIVMAVGSGMQSAALVTASSSTKVAMTGNAGIAAGGSLLYLVGWLGSLFMVILSWVGCMRASVYDRLSAGFQFGKIWKMFRHDSGGIMRIFGMYLLVGLIIGIIMAIVMTVLISIIAVICAASWASSGVTASALDNMSEAQAIQLFVQLFGAAGAIGLMLMLVCIFFCLVGSLFVDALVIRAIGYWTAQFDVPRWRGQDDPMPFEYAAPATSGYPYAVPGQPPAGTYSPYQQQPNVTYQQPMGQQPPMNAPYQQQPSANMTYQQSMDTTYQQAGTMSYQQPQMDQPPLADAPYQQAPSAQLGIDDAPADDPARPTGIGSDEDV